MTNIASLDIISGRTSKAVKLRHQLQFLNFSEEKLKDIRQFLPSYYSQIKPACICDYIKIYIVTVTCQQSPTKIVARTQKLLRTSKGGFLNEQRFSSIVSIFIMGLLLKERIREPSLCFKSCSLWYENTLFSIRVDFS